MKTARFSARHALILVISYMPIVNAVTTAATPAIWDGSSGNWSDASHWTTKPIFPNNVGGNAYQGSMSGGALTLDRAISIDSFSISGGSLVGDNPLTVATRFETNGGTTTFSSNGLLSTPLLKVGTTGTVNFNYDLVLPPTDLSGDRFGGVLGGSGNFTISNGFNWSGGLIAGTGRATFVGDHTILNTPEPLRTERNLSIMGGFFDWRATGSNASLELNKVSTLTNDTSAIFLIHGDLNVDGQDHGSQAAFINAGILRQDAANRGASFLIPFRNSGLVESIAGTMIFANGYRQTAGTTNLRGVTFSSASYYPYHNVIFDGGSVVGATTIGAPVINSAEISVGAPIGEIDVNDSLTLLNGSRLMMEIGGRVKKLQYDSIFAESVDLGGILDVRFANGFQTSITGSDSFQIISTRQIPFGAFDNVEDGRIATSDGLGSFRLITSSAGVSLSDFQAIPEPMAVLSAGAPLLFSLTRRRSR